MSTPGQPPGRRKGRPLPPPVGRVRGPDGTERDVYEAADGRQYVLGAQGEKVFGLWLLTVPPRPPAPAEEGAPAEEEPAPEGPPEEAAAAPEEAPWEHDGEVRRDRERHRGRMLSMLGTAAMCVGVMSLPAGPIGVPGLILCLLVRSAARRDLKKMDEGVMDPDGAQLTRGALQDATIGAALSGAGLLFLAVAAIWLLFYLT
jgi:hypothetical protein